MQSKNLEKIVIATGVGKQRLNSQFDTSFLPGVMKDLALITGQKPVQCLAKQSISGFKLRAGNLVGLKVTLRGKRMEDFLYRMVNIALPRVKDFRGIDPKQIDREGNLTIGFRDHSVFPEIVSEDSKFDFGLQITLVSNAKDPKVAVDSFRKMGVPLMEKK
jgi:large subunit ribosomal protein L5